MVQQINLLDPALQPRHDALSASRGMALVGTIVVGSLGLALALQWHTGRLDALMRMQAALPTPVAAAAAPASAALSASQRELDRLRALEQQQQRVRALLASGIAGTPEGYTPYLKALSRQAQGSLWITGFSVTAEGSVIRPSSSIALPSAVTEKPEIHSEPWAWRESAFRYGV